MKCSIGLIKLTLCVERKTFEDILNTAYSRATKKKCRMYETDNGHITMSGDSSFTDNAAALIEVSSLDQSSIFLDGRSIRNMAQTEKCSLRLKQEVYGFTLLYLWQRWSLKKMPKPI